MNADRLRRAARAAGAVERFVATSIRPARVLGFPYRAPSVPRGVALPVEESTLGADYDTSWARSPVARAARELVMAGPVRALVRGLAEPEIRGHDRLADLLPRDGDDDPDPVIFAPNHHSHLDIMLMVHTVPVPFRRRLFTAAAADYFFDKRWKAHLSALALNAVPVDRETTSRRSADLMAELIAEGWSLVIYPEGGRSPDGWGQRFKGGAAYLAGRTRVPVVPVHIDGTDSVLPKGTSRPKPGRTRVTFGRPLHAGEGESTRRFNGRIERAVAELADEAATDYWSARRRAAAGATPQLTGPRATGWRRKWQLTEHRRRGIAAWRQPPQRRWPDLG